MSFRHFSAVTTLKGKLECSDKKCRFSVTKASAPTHSVYAAIKASAGLKPLASYLTAISKGTTKSSSILVRIFITLINFAKSSGERWLRTSSTILREIRSVCRLYFSMIVKMRLLQGGTFTNPKPNMYTFESMTNSKLFLPEFFSNFAYCFNRFFLGHSCKWVAFFRYAFTKLLPQSFSLFYVFIFHKLLPHFYDFSTSLKSTMRLVSCQEYFVVRDRLLVFPALFSCSFSTPLIPRQRGTVACHVSGGFCAVVCRKKGTDKQSLSMPPNQIA